MFMYTIIPLLKILTGKKLKKHTQWDLKSKNINIMGLQNDCKIRVCNKTNDSSNLRNIC